MAEYREHSHECRQYRFLAIKVAYPMVLPDSFPSVLRVMKHKLDLPIKPERTTGNYFFYFRLVHFCSLKHCYRCTHTYSFRHFFGCKCMPLSTCLEAPTGFNKMCIESSHC